MKTASGDSSPTTGETDAGGGGDAHLPSDGAVHHGAGDHVLVPTSQQSLVDASYHREGSDLVLVHGDGGRTLVNDFFAHQTLPHLTTPDGAVLSGELAASLAGHSSHVQIADASSVDHQLAQAAGAAHGQPIGTVDILKGTVTSTHVDGTKVVLAKGDSVFLRDVVESEKGGSLGIVFADKTTFALGEEGRMRLDELVYSPASKSGSMGLSVLKGAFVFVSGDIAAAQSEAMTVRTPVGTIGIRGTSVGGNIAADGVASTISLLEDPHGHASAVQVTNAGGTQYLTHTNETVRIISFFTAPSTPFIATAQQISNAFGQVALELPAQQVDTTIGTGVTGSSGPRGGPPSGASTTDTGIYHGTVHVSIDSVYVSQFTGLAKAVGLSTLDLQNALFQLFAGPPHSIVFTIFTLGHDDFEHQNGFNSFNAYTVPNSLQSGDIANGGFLGHNLLTALFNSTQTIDHTLSIKNVEVINFILTSSAHVVLDASGIIAALDGTTIDVTGSGFIEINHAHDMTLDFSGFSGSYVINLDPDAGITVVPGALVVGGGTTGTALINATATTIGKILLGTPGNDTLLGGSGADTFIGRGGADSMVGGGDNDIYIVTAGAQVTAAVTIVGGVPAVITAGPLLTPTQDGHSEIRFESTTAGDTLTLTPHITTGDNTLLVDATYDTIVGGGNYAVPGYGQELGAVALDGVAVVESTATGTTALAIDASAVSLSGGVTIVGNAGNDTLIGSSNNENDVIIAGFGGSNVLESGPGVDLLDGQLSGSNLFIIRQGADFNAGDTIRGSAGADYIRFASTIAHDTLTLNGNISDPNNTMTVSASADPASVFAVGSLTGTTPLAIDAHLVTLTGGLTINANNGGDQIVGTNQNDTINGGSGGDTIGALVNGGSVFLPGGVVHSGNDSITAGSGTNLIVSDVAHLTAGVTIHGGAGQDQLLLVNGGTDNMTGFPLTGIETLGLSGATGFNLTVDGGGVATQFQDVLTSTIPGAPDASGNDTITLVNDTLTAGSTVNLGGGVNTLNLWGGGNNNVHVANVESLLGGAGNDTVTMLAGAPFNGSIDLGAGSNSLALANGTSSAFTATNVETITGGVGADNDNITLTGATNVSLTDGAGNDTIIDNGSGNSTITTLGGNNSLHGGAGNDTITTGNGADTINTGSGAATVSAGNGADTVLLGNGNDSITVGNGADTLTLGTGHDTVSAAGGNDIVLVGANADYAATDTVALGAGTDFVRFTSVTANDSLVLNATLTAVGGHLTIEASDASGVLTGTTALKIDASTVTQAITLLGNAGDDTLIGTGGVHNDTITALGGNNSIVGGAGADTITAGSGNDTINTGSGAATVNAGNGADTVLLGNGNDSVLLGTGADTVTLGTGNDTVTVGSGNDVFVVGHGDFNTNDTLTGTGHDTIQFNGTAGDNLVLNGGGANLHVGNTFASLTVDGTGAAGNVTINASALTYAVTLLGNGANDTLIGTTGANNDTITALGGANSIQGGAGADTITAGGGNDTINTGSGAATVSAGNGADTMLLGNGNDSITVGNGADTLTLGTGHDTIVAAGGNDIVLVGANADYAATDTVTLGAGTDFVRFTSVTANDSLVLNATLTAVGGHLTIEASDASGVLTGTTALKIDASTVTQAITLLGNAGADTLIGTTGSADTITALGGNNSIVGGSGADTITAGTGNDTINTGSGAATVSAGNGADTVLLGNGNDSITVGNGADTLTLGTGHDTISAAGGNDIVLVGANADYAATDTVGLGAGTDFVRFTSVTANDSLVLNATLTAVGGHLTIEASDASGVLTGTTALKIDASAVTQAVTLLGNAGADTLIGTTGSADTITALGGANSIVGGSGADTITAGAGNDTINTGSGAATVSAGNGADTVLLGNGNDSITVGNGADTLTLGTGHDTVSAAGGNDIVLVGANADYAATDTVALGAGTDFVRFTSVTANDSLVLNATLTAVGGHLTIEASDASGVLTGTTALKIDASTVTQAITLLGNAGDDTLIGTGGVHNDTITALGGNNSIVGGAGADTITAGSGNDTINTGSGAATVNAGNGADTVLLGNGNDSVLLGTGADTVTLGTGNDTVTVGSGNDVFVVGHGDFNTNDTLTGTGHDTIQFNGTAGDNLVLNGGGANLHVGNTFASLTVDGTGAAGNVTINASALTYAVTLLGNGANDTLIGTTGANNDTITALGGANSIQGGAGADTITAGGGNDTINTGSGAATVSAGNGADTMLLGNGNDSITVGNGADTLTLGTGHDTIVAAGGNDIVLVGANADYAATDTVTLGAGTDFVRFTSVTANDSLVLNATLTAVGGHLTIEASDASGVLTGTTALKIDASTVTQAITLLGNAGADTLIGTTGSADTITALGGNNSIVGGSGADTITAGTGNDTINTGSGAATVSAGNGADTVLLGNGNDSITVGNGADTLTLGTGHDTISAAGGNDIVLVGANADYAATDTVGLGAGTDFVRFTSVTANDSLVLNATLTAVGGHLTIEASDASGVLTGTTALKIDASAVTQAVTLLGNAGADTLIGTTGSADTITALGGANSIVGGSGADTITAGAGNDTINTGSGAATVSAGNGADTVLLGNGNDSITVGNGADTLTLGTGHDTVSAAGGNDIVLVGANADYAATDTVALGAGTDFVRFTSVTANDSLVLNATLTAVGGHLTIEASDASGVLTGTTALKIDASTVTQAITLLGNAGDDTLIGTGGVHNDTITALGGNNSIVGGAGADTITAGSGNDTINTGSGAATVNAGNGADTVLLGNGNDSVLLGTGADTVTLGTGNDTVTVGSGNDVFVVGHGDFNTNDTLTGTGHDTIQFNGTAGDNLVLNGGGANLHVGNTFASLTVDGTGAAGNVTINASALTYAVTLLGNGANDTLIGTTGANNDTITALGGANSIQGGAGNESVTVGNGADTVTVGNGADTVVFGNGNDSIAVGSGADTLTLGSGSDTITAAGGNDVLLVATNADYAATDTVTLGAGSDFVRFTSVTANDSLVLNATLTAAHLTIEASDASGVLTGTTALKIDAHLMTQAITLLGNAGADTLIGTTGSADTITALGGANSIVGGSGADTITAGAGNDTINTGSGAATVSAGNGADTILLGNGSDSIAVGTGADTIALGTGSDTIGAGGGNDIVLVAVGADYAATDTVTLGAGTDFVRFTSTTANDSLVLNGHITAGSLTIEASDASGVLTGTTALKIDASAVTQAVTLLGNASADTLIGTAGSNDTITAGNGANSVSAGNGNDSITVGNGNDTITAGNGADTLVFGSGSDSITLGTGADTLTFGSGTDTVVTSGNDVFLVAGAADFTAGDSISAAGHTEIIRFTSTTATDSLTLSSHITAGALTVEASDASGVLTGTTALKINASAVTQAITLLGNAGADTLIGTTGSADTITALGGNNSIVGGSGADTITAGAGNDTINTGSGAATVNAGNGADTVLLGNGNDSVLLGTGADTVTLGTGNDTVTVGSGNDVFVVGHGDFNTNDTLTGTGHDTIQFNGTAGDNLVLNGGGANLHVGNTFASLTVDGTGAAGNVTINASALTYAVTLLGNGANDTLIGTTGANNDTITALGGANSIQGGAGNESVTVGNGADTVTVGNGADTVVFGNGNDSIAVGSGADTLTLGSGSDTITAAGGNDVLLVATNADYAATDTVTLGAGSDFVRFTSVTANDSLVLNATLTAAHLTIEASDASGVLTGTTALKIDAHLMTQAITLLGNAGADTLIGTTGSADTITALGGANSIVGGSGADTITAGAGNDTINTGSGAATVSAGNGADTILLGNGSDSIAVGTGADTIALGTGSDTIGAGGGNDIVLVAVGADYAATDTVTLGAGTDFVRFTSTTANDSLVLNGHITAGSLTIEASDASGVLTGTTALKIDASAVTQAVTLLGNASADTLIGTAGSNDTITAGNGANSVSAGNGNDSITVGNGNDTITAGNGADTLVFGSGSDSITLGTGADTLTFGSGTDTVVTSGNDVFLVAGAADFTAGDSISAAGHTEIIRFTSTTATDSLTLSSHITAGALTVEASDASGVLTGTTALKINASAVTQAITLLGNAGADTLIGTTGSADTITALGGNNSIVGGSGADTITAGAGNDTINTGSGAATVSAGNGADTVLLGNGNDSIAVGTGADTIALGTGSDTISSGGGNDILLVGLGTDYAATDTITLGAGADFLRFTSTTAGDTLTLNGHITAGSLTIEASDASGVLSGTTALVIDAHLVTQAITLLGDQGGDTLIGTTGFNDTITALDGANSISAGSGNDLITVGNGSDTIAAGSGNDTITVGNGNSDAITLGNGTDSVALGNGNFDNVTLGNGVDTISLGTGDDTVTTGGNDVFLISAPGHYNSFNVISAAGHAETIRFTDTNAGDTLNLNSNITASSLTVEASDAAGVTTGTTSLTINASSVGFGITLIANNGGDSLVGTSHGDTITGGTGDDTITVGSVASTITGGGGGDVISSGGAADNFRYVATTDSFSNAAAAADGHTDVINNFHDSGPAATIDLTNLAGAGTENFAGLKAGATFALAFTGDTANTVDYAVIGGNTFLHVASGSGYSAGDLLIELQGVHALTAANVHLHP